MSRIFLEKYNMIALKSSTGSIWERRENDKEELPQSEQRVCRQLVGKLLWIYGVHLRCAVSEASSNLGRASETDMKNIRAILRYLRANPGVVTLEPLQFSLEIVKKMR